MSQQERIRQTGKCIVIFMIVILCGCKSNMKAGKNGEYDVVTPETCGTDFDTFFERFASDSVFQVKHVNFPITEYYSDEDFPLDIMERVTFEEEDYAFIDLSKDKVADKREKDPYRIEIEKQNDSIFYRQHGINNYINVTYKFARKDNCWWLVEIQDMTD
jgi:Domain of unknown function (DUF4348)